VPFLDKSEYQYQESEALARSREARLTTILLIAKIISRHGEAPCRIRNLSSGGLMVEAHVPLEADELVQIELKAGDQLAGRIRWTDEGRIGIAFDEPIEVGTVLARAAAKTVAQGLVRAPRFGVDCPIELRSDGRRYVGRLINLSQGGARVEAGCETEPDQLFTLAIPGLSERHGAVRWLLDGTLGFAFLEPLSFDELGLWLALQAREA
jgi:hypothetical protein